MQPEHMLTHSMTPLYMLKTTLVPFANTGVAQNDTNLKALRKKEKGWGDC